MKKAGYVLAVVISFILLFPGISLAGKEDLVGTRIVGDMKIEFYMESPKKGMVMTSGKKMPMHNPAPTIIRRLKSSIPKPVNSSHIWTWKRCLSISPATEFSK